MFTTLFEKYLRREAAALLKVAWKAGKQHVHAAGFSNDGKEDEERRAGSRKSENIGTVALWVQSANKLYSAVRGEVFCWRARQRKSELFWPAS